MRKRKVNYPVARTATRQVRTVGLPGDPGYVRSTVAEINLAALTGRDDISVGDRVRIGGRRTLRRRAGRRGLDRRRADPRRHGPHRCRQDAASPGRGPAAGRSRGQDLRRDGPARRVTPRWPAPAPVQRMTSPARISRSSRFSGGESGHDQRGSKAHEGWYAKLKSTITVPLVGSPPRSAPFELSIR